MVFGLSLISLELTNFFFFTKVVELAFKETENATNQNPKTPKPQNPKQDLLLNHLSLNFSFSAALYIRWAARLPFFFANIVRSWWSIET